MGIRSPIRTRLIPLILIPVLHPVGRITKGYGAPVTEFVIWQIEPLTARGIPAADAIACGTETIIPESGGPAAPGVRITEQPIVTG
jgi:hypothetical protein